MPFALLLALAATAGATALTYAYDRDANLWARLCAGVCVGFAVLGLVGFACASALGMGPAALVLAGALAGSPLLLFLRREWRGRVSADARESLKALRLALARPGKGATGALVFYLAAALLFWFVCGRVMFEKAEDDSAGDGGRVQARVTGGKGPGVFTGVDTNIGDLPFHLAVITGFAHGENFPPQHPELAGVRLTYPFVADFVTAMFVRAGASLAGALFWQNYAMLLALAGLLHRWAWRLTRDRAAALMTPALVLLSGGFGWVVFLKQALKDGRGLFQMLGALPQDYTIMRHLGIAWGNAVTALFVPQRSILLGVGVALVVWTLWWEGTEELAEGGRRKAAEEAAGKDVREKGRRKEKHRRAGAEPGAVQESSTAFPLAPSAFSQMLAAGLIAGLLPLVHAHSFVVLMAMGGCLALVQTALGRKGGGDGAGESAWPWAVWRPWLAFFAAAAVVAVPQMWWATSGSAVQSSRFFGWEFGWDRGQENAAWFWFKNTGLFIPLLVVALAWRGRGRVVPPRLFYFYLPFTLCFVVPNLYKLSPWVWDNIKVLLYWWIASAPLVALVLARLWRGGAGPRLAAVGLLLALTGAGALDVWRVASGAVAHQTFSADGVRFAELIKSRTPPRALILHAPTYNDPVYLSGRRTFLGYPGHVWSHGLDYAAREEQLKRIYAGGPDAARLLAQSGIEYVVVGPLEEAEMLNRQTRLNRGFFERYTKVGEVGEYRLYQTAQP